MQAKTLDALFKAFVERLQNVYDYREAVAISKMAISHLFDFTSWADFVLKRSEKVSEEISSRCNQWLKKLESGQPIQQLMGSVEFCGLDIRVDENVLIPRPETEELVAFAAKRLKGTEHVLEIGSGSGCIALALKNYCKSLQIVSVDVSDKALIIARENAQNLKLDVEFRKLDFLSQNQRQSLGRFDILVSNPPYIPEAERRFMHENVLKYEPERALFTEDKDPDIFYREMAKWAKGNLSENGQLFLEMNSNRSSEIEQIVASCNFKTEVFEDMQGKPRVLHAIKK